MVTREQVRCHAGVGLGQRVSTDHAPHVACVSRTVLLPHAVSWSAHPVFGVLRPVTKNILVHLGRSRQISLASHTLLESNPAQIVLYSSSLADILVDAASSLAKQLILGGHEACVAWQVLTGPGSWLLWQMVLTNRHL